MINRLVRQLVPVPTKDEAGLPRTFLDYLGRSNVVVLGDPGSGKSHLLQGVADGVARLYVTARNFLNTPTFPENAELLIDALDEKRAGRGDDATIDQMVQKLFAIRPKRVCIACRAQDWLGETDLAVFRSYFNSSGGVVVLGIEPLTTEEQIAVLAGKGHSKPREFLSEASDRGLEDFLTNPQNLRMLSDVVQGGTWPETRRELFELSTRMLLTEHNSQKIQALDGSFGADELRDAAGAACAIRLISDTDGLSLANTDPSADCPSYRNIRFDDAEKVRAALGRRAFVSAAGDSRVDYAHRTVAEFLAASWLAKTVRGGLPIGRVCALIGIDGRPASELRGLNAWLSVMLPESAEAFIHGDPYGVLTYGDVKSLTPSVRRALLNALAILSLEDPWFRAGNWTVAGIGGLSSAEIVEDFRLILRSVSSSSSLRSVVLDALCKGKAQSGLVPDLLALVVDDRFHDQERIQAAEAVARCGPKERAALAKVYLESIAENQSAIRLRGGIIALLYGDQLGASAVARLLVDTFRSEEDLPGGTLWLLQNQIPTKDIPLILDEFSQNAPKENAEREIENIWEITSALDRLLIRALADTNVPIAVESLWKWLEARASTDARNIRDYADEGKSALLGRPGMVDALCEYALASYKSGDAWWRFLQKIDQLTFGNYNRISLFNSIAARIADPKTERGIALELYQLAFGIVYGVEREERPERLFEILFALGDTEPALAKSRDDAVSCKIETWRTEQRSRAARSKEKTDDRRKKNRQAIEDNLETIKAGENLGFLGWCGELYFERHDTAGPNPLEAEIGQKLFLPVKEGFRNLLKCCASQSPKSVLDVAVQNRYWKWWYALVAGMDEYWSLHRSVEKLSDDLLGSLVVIDTLHPTFVSTGNVEKQREHEWKTWLIKNRPSLVRDSYLQIAKAKLTVNAVMVDGLYELLHHEAFAQYRAQTSFELVRAFPLIPTQYLEDMLRSILEDDAVRAELVDVARANVSSPIITADSDRHDLWLSAAYFADPEQFRAQLIERAQSRSEIVWRLRNLIFERRPRDAKDAKWGLRDDQIFDMIRIVAAHFKNASHPRSWGGDTNPWDAADFVRKLIDQLSSNATTFATSLLSQLVEDDSLESYRDHLKHALSNQRVRYVDAVYSQPDWRQTTDALAKLKPANAADLQALLVAQLRDLIGHIAHSNTDIYKGFWNEDSYGRLASPKSEESGRDVLVGLLRQRLTVLGLIVEPEGHMANDKRVDISVSSSDLKGLIELKRDCHPEVWSSAEGQLERLYVRDPAASGYGIYGVFWYGNKRRAKIPPVPDGAARPKSAIEMEAMIRERLSVEKRRRLEVVVFDVSGVIP